MAMGGRFPAILPLLQLVDAFEGLGYKLLCRISVVGYITYTSNSVDVTVLREAPAL